MTYYIIQTLILLVVAYFLGAWIGCALRSISSYRVNLREAAVGPSGEGVADGRGPEKQKIVSAKTETDLQESDRGSAAVQRAGEVEAKSDGAPAGDQETSKARSAESQRTTSEDDEATAKKRQAIEAAALAAATAAAATITGEGAKDDAGKAAKGHDTGSGARTAATPAGLVERRTGADEGKADNLQRIKGIDPGLMERLKALGVTRYAQIAEWKAGDVTEISQKLELSGRVGPENWIEQAKILADGGVTVFAHNFDRGRIPASMPAAAQPLEDVGKTAEAQVANAAAPAAAPSAGDAADDEQADERHENDAADEKAGSAETAETRTAEDDLTNIRGIDRELVGKLAALNVRSFQQIADWNGDDVKHIGAELGFSGRIQRQNWIEQASLLASGAMTKYASKRSLSGTPDAG